MQKIIIYALQKLKETWIGGSDAHEAHGETLDVILKGMQVGLLIGNEGSLLEHHFLWKIILHDLRDMPTGFAMLMGAIYCLNLEYPRTQK
ncbi:hypothetical protein KUCAC02_009704 [Chaenocephalus aceratus]|nr:hypothetical protein KUCAC02_009704 [Chaenocephalus aceratus]